MLLLHGFTGSAASWSDVAALLRSLGREPVALDLPGHGSRAGEADPAAFTLASVLGLVDQAAGMTVGGQAGVSADGLVGRPLDLVGYSMGARLALHYAAARPVCVRRLVLESGSPGLETEEEREERRGTDAALAQRILEDGVGAFVEAWEALPLFAGEGVGEAAAARRRAIRGANDAASLAAALRGLGAGALPSLWDRLGDIGAPTLLIVGERDGKFVRVAERMASALPTARLVVVAGAGHAVHLERPDAWADAVAAFLDEGRHAAPEAT